MSNQIRPVSRVFVPGDAVVVEIAVEAGLSAYTWVVIALDPVAQRDQLVAHGSRPKSGTRKPSTSASVTVSAELAVGDYVVRLFAGKPASPDDVTSFLASAELLDEDTFSVLDEGVGAVPGSQPTRATPERFREFLAARWGHEDQSMPYQALQDAAREFVGQANVPAVELIWNYWLEEGMLPQTLEVILARFQNRRLPGRDPLARFDLSPLLPLRNLLWGYAEDQVHRTTVRRRAAEYEYEYGLTLLASGTSRPEPVVERRGRFVETFHRALFLGQRYLNDLDDLAMQADAFPLFLALRDCHMVLSQGAHNQFGAMALAARAEFLVMQTLISEAELRTLLGGRPMTPYPQPWMDRVDAMKSIQGWTDTSIVHFHDLADDGEQLVLSIRLGNWAAPAVNHIEAATWARAFRPSIQRYVAAYRAVTGVDLAREANGDLPSTLMARRLGGAEEAGDR